MYYSTALSLLTSIIFPSGTTIPLWVPMLLAAITMLLAIAGTYLVLKPILFPVPTNGLLEEQDQALIDKAKKIFGAKGNADSLSPKEQEQLKQAFQETLDYRQAILNAIRREETIEKTPAEIEAEAKAETTHRRKILKEAIKQSPGLLSLVTELLAKFDNAENQGKVGRALTKDGVEKQTAELVLNLSPDFDDLREYHQALKKKLQPLLTPNEEHKPVDSKQLEKELREMQSYRAALISAIKKEGVLDDTLLAEDTQQLRKHIKNLIKKHPDPLVLLSLLFPFPIPNLKGSKSCDYLATELKRIKDEKPNPEQKEQLKNEFLFLLFPDLDDLKAQNQLLVEQVKNLLRLGNDEQKDPTQLKCELEQIKNHYAHLMKILDEEGIIDNQAILKELADCRKLIREAVAKHPDPLSVLPLLFPFPIPELNKKLEGSPYLLGELSAIKDQKPGNDEQKSSLKNKFLSLLFPDLSDLQTQNSAIVAKVKEIAGRNGHYAPQERETLKQELTKIKNDYLHLMKILEEDGVINSWDEMSARRKAIRETLETHPDPLALLPCLFPFPIPELNGSKDNLHLKKKLERIIRQASEMSEEKEKEQLKTEFLSLLFPTISDLEKQNQALMETVQSILNRGNTKYTPTEFKQIKQTLEQRNKARRTTINALMREGVISNETLEAQAKELQNLIGNAIQNPAALYKLLPFFSDSSSPEQKQNSVLMEAILKIVGPPGGRKKIASMKKRLPQLKKELLPLLFPDIHDLKEKNKALLDKMGEIKAACVPGKVFSPQEIKDFKKDLEKIHYHRRVIINGLIEQGIDGRILKETVQEVKDFIKLANQNNPQLEQIFGSVGSSDGKSAKAGHWDSKKLIAKYCPERKGEDPEALENLETLADRQALEDLINAGGALFQKIKEILDECQGKDESTAEGILQPYYKNGEYKRDDSSLMHLKQDFQEKIDNCQKRGLGNRMVPIVYFAIKVMFKLYSDLNVRLGKETTTKLGLKENDNDDPMFIYLGNAASKLRDKLRTILEDQQSMPSAQALAELEKLEEDFKIVFSCYFKGKPWNEMTNKGLPERIKAIFEELTTLHKAFEQRMGGSYGEEKEEVVAEEKREAKMTNGNLAAKEKHIHWKDAWTRKTGEEEKAEPAKGDAEINPEATPLTEESAEDAVPLYTYSTRDILMMFNVKLPTVTSREEKDAEEEENYDNDFAKQQCEVATPSPVLKSAIKAPKAPVEPTLPNEADQGKKEGVQRT